ncbi:MAG: hypothetical protein M3Y87_00020 [Myxococcota bacterium]|nr:hypothetical protein [Myxococcota bacterium]
MSSLAVVTVAYPAARPFLAEMAESLRAQSDRAFTVIVLDDGCGNVLHAFDGLSARVIAAGASIADNRRVAIGAAIDAGFSQLVLADADDTFSADRVARSRRALDEHPLVFNELRIGDAPVFGARFERGASIDLGAILDGNCLGLSNTAARAEVLAEPARAIDVDEHIVDWGLFTRALAAGHRAVFLDDVYTHYRRHEASLGTLDADDEAAVIRALEVKASHYRRFAARCAAFAERADAFGALLARIREDDDTRREYVRFCRASAPAHPLWWEIARRMP